jgi:GNAT superfamily N-acetyltransferase
MGVILMRPPGHICNGTEPVSKRGLLPAFIGQGLGGHLLTVAVERAWAPTGADQDVGGGMGATRVWLHTCSHDHPHALQNYVALGCSSSSSCLAQANLRRRAVG